MRSTIFIVVTLATICPLLARPPMVQAAPLYLSLPKHMKICETADQDKSVVCGKLTWGTHGASPALSSTYQAVFDDGRFGSVDIPQNLAASSGATCTFVGVTEMYGNPRDTNSIFYAPDATGPGSLEGVWNGKQITGHGYTPHLVNAPNTTFTFVATPVSVEQIGRDTQTGGGATPACRLGGTSPKSTAHRAAPTPSSHVAVSTARPISQSSAQTLLAQELAKAVALHEITPEQAKMTLDLAKQNGLSVSGNSSSLQTDRATPPSATPGPGQFIDPNFAWPKGHYIPPPFTEADEETKGGSHALITWSYKGNTVCVGIPNRDGQVTQYLGFDDKGSYLMSDSGIEIWSSKTKYLTGYAHRTGPNPDDLKTPDPLLLDRRGVGSCQ